MQQTTFPVIDPVATGENILRLRKQRGLSVRDLQSYFGFEEPQAIYKWQRGKSLPTVDNLYALSALLHVPMEHILVSTTSNQQLTIFEQQAQACCSAFFRAECPGWSRSPSLLRPFSSLRGWTYAVRRPKGCINDQIDRAS